MTPELEREARIYLASIESSSRWAKNKVGDIGFAVRMLQSRPDFCTRAEDEMIRLESELRDLLGRVRSINANYHQKPQAA